MWSRMEPLLPPGYIHTQGGGYSAGCVPHQLLPPVIENSERRKEKSRDAARCRRSRETEIFTDLAHALPLPEKTVKSLDKASVMRLAISFLRVQSIVDQIPAELRTPEVSSEHDALFLKALEGFLLIVSADGDIVFLSENVNEYLGLSQIDLMGQSIYEVSHPCDHNEVKEILTGKDIESLQRTFFLRMKCTLTSKGRNVNLKSASYKVIHCTGHMVSSGNEPTEKDSPGEDGADKDGSAGSQSQVCLVAIGEPIPHPANIETPLGYQTFLSKHSLDMKFTYADEKMAEFLGYDPDALINKSAFEFFHAQDSQAIGKAFKSLITKGQTQTGRYRFLAQGGGFVWVLTQATLIYNNKGQKPQSIVCVHFVTSGVEHKDEIYSCCQLENAAVKRELEVKQSAEQVVREAFAVPRVASKSPESVTVTVPRRPPESVTVTVPRPQVVTSTVIAPAPAPVKCAPQAEPPRPTSVTAQLFAKVPVNPEPQLPQAATSKIFAPRTEEMNKGFLMPSEDETGLTMMKDEPEDLTHLAPSCGPADVACVPLFNTCGPLFTDVLDHFMLSENYGPLLSETSKEISPASSPYCSYRDELSSGSLSPTLTRSPGASSLPSLLGEESSPLDEGTSMNTLLGLDIVDSLDSDDFSVKAPYISMNDDMMPLLMSHDMMWGAEPSAIGKNGWSPPSPTAVEKPDLDSSLAKLLRSDSAKSQHSFQQHSSSNTPHNLFSQKKGETERRKRPVSDGGGSARTSSKRSKQSTIPRPGVLDGGGKPPPNGGSVLMNLLVSGCDVSAGYICLNARKPYVHSYTPSLWS